MRHASSSSSSCLLSYASTVECGLLLTIDRRETGLVSAGAVPLGGGVAGGVEGVEEADSAAGEAGRGGASDTMASDCTRVLLGETGREWEVAACTGSGGLSTSRWDMVGPVLVRRWEGVGGR